VGLIPSQSQCNSRSQPRHVIANVPIRRIDRGFEHQLWSPNSFGATTVLFGPWLWVHLAVDRKKLYLGIYKG